MNSTTLVFCLLSLLPATTQENLSNLEQLDQIRADVAQMVSQPDYVGEPSYLLLVLGKEGKKMIWMSVDREFAYVDLNENREFAVSDEKFELDFNSDDTDGTRGATLFKFGPIDGKMFLVQVNPVDSIQDAEARSRYEEENWLSGKLTVLANGSGYSTCKLIFSRDINDAQTIWLNGGLQLIPWRFDQELSTKRTILSCRIASPSLLPKNCSSQIFAIHRAASVPGVSRIARPSARIEYPNSVVDEHLLDEIKGFRYSGVIDSKNMVAGQQAQVTLSFEESEVSQIGNFQFKVPITNEPDNDFTRQFETLRIRIEEAEEELIELKRRMNRLQGESDK